MASGAQRHVQEKWVARWLFTVAGMVFFMVILGGVTRLTGSGLSMTDWHPVTGWLPPMTDVAWAKLFAAYQATPEFRYINPTMDVEGFKGIFWLEYLHRVFGRMIGLAFGVPLLFFLIKGWLPGVLKWKAIGLFILGGSQGVLGWYMVQSGLVDEPDVSQYRLAAHLGLAIVIYMALVWTGLGVREARMGPGDTLSRLTTALVALGFLTVVSGAFVAGLNAGKIFNTFPLMEGGLLPPDGLPLAPLHLNFFEDPGVVQFQHRLLAITTLGAVGALWFHLRQSSEASLRKAGHFVAIAAGCQVLLGIATLMLVVPLPLAALHQAGAVVLLTALLYVLHRIRVQTPPRL